MSHWQVTLQEPLRRGRTEQLIDGRKVATSSAGTLAASGKACEVAAGGIVARCRIGEGKVTVIADADFLNPDEVNFIKTGQPDSGNFQFLLAELALLER